MKNNSAGKIHMATLDELLGSSDTYGRKAEPAGEKAAQVVRLPLNRLHTFHSHKKGHPFRVLDDEKMAETVESVKQYGVLIPGIARPDKDFPGEYEIIAGHRRHRASQLAGEKDMPVIVRDMSDAEATVIMVDSNIQREDMLPSERAWAYRMRYEAMKELNVPDNGIRNDQVLAKETGISRNTIQRYIRLTYLTPELLQMVDDNRLKIISASDLSYLEEREQLQLLEVINELRIIPSGEQAVKLKEFSRENTLSASVMKFVLEKTEDTEKVTLPAKKIRSYFPESYTGEQIQTIVYQLLEEWAAKAENTV